MNALNILSGLSSTPPATPQPSRTPSSGNVSSAEADSEGSEGVKDEVEEKDVKIEHEEEEEQEGSATPESDEKTPLLSDSFTTPGPGSSRTAWNLPRRIAQAIAASVGVVIATIAAPARFLVACFYDENGVFSAILPIKRLARKKRRKSAPQAPVALTLSASDGATEKPWRRPRLEVPSESDEDDGYAVSNASTTPTDEKGEFGAEGSDDNPSRNTRSRTAARDDIIPAKRSIRIKLHNEAGKKPPRHRQQQSIDRIRSEEEQVTAVANSLKSPSSPGTKLKYPRAPAPPRPLIPRRQPSYAPPPPGADAPKKTLIIDLDETLIHSMAKGGRMSTGHMVEVKFQGPMSNGITAILYYVHERPYCHEFLRKVCKWYNLIVFTASVQEYADPVIDWLERERSYFKYRYYRQHCTFRNGAYIKDLSTVEPDLSKVMILDNSPMSYIFHEDNAIPIEGWISDPTDSDLLHLVPLLEGLQYATDVRALLALRLGQADRS